ncbi:Biotin-protein ligase [Candidatus Jidaibacter acanthamoeba]|uniref:Biotin-protein ligase n=1 Tax=Candidatus Jidaibacter acanthamoebae TaxID=86105 RepID=A0A0C1MSB2_9RICK|nr:BPL-N domain-containing protein [Candidatus Jidaibacter acanthamoeba]KIE04942.1 Biotin-protein ligase [Candidatus Jidaibacter acanthamoeba]
MKAKFYYILIVIVITISPFVSLAFGAQEKNTVYVYHDEGVSDESLLHTISTLKTILPSSYIVNKINANEVIEYKWTNKAALFVMPGGADLPYVKKLNGKGNKNIKNYVSNGGSYLGICAGAYYASAYVEFDQGGELEVLGDRELAFFPGKSIGSILAKYNYKNNSGSRASKLHITLDNVKETVTYYNGGGYFADANKYPNITVIGYYENNLPSIIHIAYEKGNVILSGVHFEYKPSLFDANDPYLKDILPALERHNISRNLLTIEILKKLGINYN